MWHETTLGMLFQMLGSLRPITSGFEGFAPPGLLFRYIKFQCCTVSSHLFSTWLVFWTPKEVHLILRSAPIAIKRPAKSKWAKYRPLLILRSCAQQSLNRSPAFLPGPRLYILRIRNRRRTLSKRTAGPPNQISDEYQFGSQIGSVDLPFALFRRNHCMRVAPKSDRNQTGPVRSHPRSTSDNPAL